MSSHNPKNCSNLGQGASGQNQIYSLDAVSDTQIYEAPPQGAKFWHGKVA